MNISLILFLWLIYLPCASTQSGTNNTNDTDANATTVSSSSTAPTLPVPVTLPVTTPFVPVTVRPDSDLEFGVNRVVPFCTCDITPTACDVNCCCDGKCSADVREAFTSCDELSQLASSYSVCIPKSALFLQNSPFVSETAGNSVCLTESNQAEDFLNIPQIIREEDVFDEYIRRHTSSYSYSSAVDSSNVNTVEDVNYKHGDTVYILSDQNLRATLTLPGGTGALPSSSTCVSNSPAMFLINSHTSCKQELTDCIALGRGTAVEDYTPAKFRVISSPYLASANEISVNSLIDVVIDTSKGSLYKTNLDPTTGICYNVVTKVEYTIQHTAGVIQRVSLALETSDFNSTVTSISQEFAVTYTESNKPPNPLYLAVGIQATLLVSQSYRAG
ncbi:TCTN1 [Bugula neritina]|uniref:TCTN1 n=1 Tax=Bugula neritina TaxID=10212 RepID=A0A7J7JLY3_BUGNE|nr:TCTN1 [Bugula neritina]